MTRYLKLDIRLFRSMIKKTTENESLIVYEEYAPSAFHNQ